MPRYICKIQDYYLEYSTIVDAPVTIGMSLDEFMDYYKDEYGRRGMEGPDFENRMKRAEEKGTSARDYEDFEELISGNRAGKDESCLSKEQIIEWYCRRREECDQGKPCPLMGKVFNFDTEEYEDAKEVDKGTD